MKRVLLDTNIYGEMILDKEASLLIEKQKKNTQYLIYGFPFIRHELRSTPKNKTYQKKNIRIALLTLYDLIIGKHTLVVNFHELNTLGERYYKIYKELGGSYGKEELISDFIIVACASLKKMDIVVSNDDSTMLSELSLKAYIITNQTLGLENPQFIGYEKFKQLLLRA